MKYPTLAEVEEATQVQLASWYRFLPVGNSNLKIKIMQRICIRFNHGGGMTPEISTQLGGQNDNDSRQAIKLHSNG